MSSREYYREYNQREEVKARRRERYKKRRDTIRAAYYEVWL